MKLITSLFFFLLPILGLAQSQRVLIYQANFDNRLDEVLRFSSRPSYSLAASEAVQPTFDPEEGTRACAFRGNGDGWKYTLYGPSLDLSGYDSITFTFSLGAFTYKDDKQGLDQTDKVSLYFQRELDANDKKTDHRKGVFKYGRAQKILCLRGGNVLKGGFFTDKSSSRYDHVYDYRKLPSGESSQFLSRHSITHVPSDSLFSFCMTFQVDRGDEIIGLSALKITGVRKQGWQVISPVELPQFDASQISQLALRGIWTDVRIKELREKLTPHLLRLKALDLRLATLPQSFDLSGFVKGAQILTEVYCNTLPSTYYHPMPEVNPNCIVFLPPQYSDRERKIVHYGDIDDVNVVFGSSAPFIKLQGAYPYHTERYFHADSVVYTRYFDPEIKSGINQQVAGWQSISLPFIPTRVVAQDRGGYPLIPFYDNREVDFQRTRPYWLSAYGANNEFDMKSEFDSYRAYIMCLPNHEQYDEIYNIHGNVVFSAGSSAMHSPTFLQALRLNTDLMESTFKGKTSHARFYVLDDFGSEFIPSHQSINPLSGYCTYQGDLAHAPLSISLGDIGGTITGIEAMQIPARKQPVSLRPAQGGVWVTAEREQIVRIYNLEGVQLKSFQVSASQERWVALPSGIYLIAGQKCLVL